MKKSKKIKKLEKRIRKLERDRLDNAKSTPHRLKEAIYKLNMGNKTLSAQLDTCKLQYHFTKQDFMNSLRELRNK